MVFSDIIMIGVVDKDTALKHNKHDSGTEKVYVAGEVGELRAVIEVNTKKWGIGGKTAPESLLRGHVRLTPC